MQLDFLVYDNSWSGVFGISHGKTENKPLFWNPLKSDTSKNSSAYK